MKPCERALRDRGWAAARFASPSLALLMSFSLSASCSHADMRETQTNERIAETQAGEPIFWLSDQQLSDAFKNVAVTWRGDDPDRVTGETFYDGGRYVYGATADIILYLKKEGRFWIQ